MKFGLALLSLAFVIPSLGSAIELEAERECRDRLWQGRVGALVTLNVRHPQVGQSSITGILNKVENDRLDFGGVSVDAGRVIDASVVVPQKGDLITMSFVQDKQVVSEATIFDRIENGRVYGLNMSVTAAALVGELAVVRAGTKVYVEFYYPGTGHRESSKDSGFFTFKRVHGSTLHFGDGLILPLSAIVRLQIARP